MTPKQKEELFTNKVVNSFVYKNELFTLEKRADNLYVIKAPGMNTSIHTTLQPAEDKFNALKLKLKGGEKNMDGYDKAKEIAEKLKEEKSEKEELEVLKKEEIVNELAALASNTTLAQMYKDNSTLGADNLGGELPILKVHAVGKSTKNELADGSEPNDGYFFYKQTGEQFETIDCHILTISRGYKATPMEEGGKPQFNQLVGGVFGEDYKPFIMYFSGTKLQRLWEFGKTVSKYTHAKPVSIPMFALTVRMSTEKIQTSFGKSWVINFEIVRSDDKNSPKIVLDEGEFTFLKDTVESTQQMIESIITNRSVKVEEIISANVVNEGEPLPFE